VGTQRPAAPSSAHAGRGEGVVNASGFDACVVCVPAPDALAISGVAEALPALELRVLRAVGYDARTAHAIFFDHRLAPRIQDLFDNGGGYGDETDPVAEINLDGQIAGGVSCEGYDGPGAGLGLHLVAWQGAKRQRSGGCVVAHSRAKQSVVASSSLATATAADGGVALPIELVYAALAKRIGGGLSAADVEGMVLHTKSVEWTVAQMSRPMEAVVNNPPTPPWCCMEGAGSAGAGLIVAGDFMTQSSFLGCYASADAAVRAVLLGTASGSHLRPR
jgi:hypothetical protein